MNGSTERALWLAVIETVMRDALKPRKRKNTRDMINGIQYFTRPSSSFNEVCHLAGLESGYVRRKFIAKATKLGLEEYF